MTRSLPIFTVNGQTTQTGGLVGGHELNLVNYYINSSSIEAALSSSSTGYSEINASSLLNEFNKEIIFRTDYTNLSRHIYFSNAYYKTKRIIDDITQTYPIGISGSATSNLWKSDIDKAVLYIKSLDSYEYFCLRGLCGETLTGNMSYTAAATAVSISLSASLPASFNVLALPVLYRDANNVLLEPQGPSYGIYDQYFNDRQVAILDNNDTALTYYEQLLQNALSFDRGVQTILGNSSGTGSHEFLFETYNGTERSKIVPKILTAGYSRSEDLTKLIEGESYEGDEQNMLVNMLQVMATVYDELKIYADNLTSLFRNYFGNINNIPLGNIQKLVAYQLGIELFDSSNNTLMDSFVYRDVTAKEATWHFWNRILSSLTYIYKTKGTLESLRATAKAYGLTENFVDIAELNDSLISEKYNLVRAKNTATARFGNLSTKTQFQKITVRNDSSLSATYSPKVNESFDLTFRLKFIDNILDNSLTLQSKVFENSTSSIAVSYGTKVSSSDGSKFISFDFKCGSSSLTTDYSFYTNLKDYAHNDWNTFKFSRSGTTMSISHGYVLPSVLYEVPQIQTITGLTNSTTLVASGYAIGSDSPTTLGNFLLQEIQLSKGSMSDIMFEDKVSNYENSQSPSAFIFSYRLRENVDFTTGGEDYIIDSSDNNLTGNPTLYGSVGSGLYPYVYEYGLTKQHKQRLAGFGIRMSDEAEGAAKFINSHDVRAGISLAAPIDELALNKFGDLSISDLFADPNYVFSKAPFTVGENLSTLQSVHSDVISSFGTIGDVTNDILRTVNRVHGHLASFFKLIRQLIPASRSLLEVGLLVEEYKTRRQIVKRSTIAIEQLVQEKDELIYQEVTVDDESPKESDIAVIQDVSVVDGMHNVSVSGDTYATAENIHRPEDSPDIGINFETDGAIFTCEDEVFLNVGQIYSEDVQRIDSIERPLNKMFFRYHASNQRMYNKIASANASTALMQLSFNARKIFISTKASAQVEHKTLNAYVSMLDVYTGKYFTTEYDAVEVDMTDCLSGSLNRLRFIVNGSDMFWNQNTFRFNIPYKTAKQFTITSTGSLNEGVNSNSSYKIRFRNLLNPDDSIQELTFFLGETVENMTQQEGFVIASALS
jgi:hypothetical protein